ncbi:hypothetical protein ACD661_07375 [Legionella lytica]|uniref:Uncharacterized protein n=1 Tax=Legionella lytica TaxID=96232 RepID=A0ABW8D6P3_9GAMM
MPTFFQQKSTYDTTMQVVNGVAAVLAIGQMIADPSTSWRFGWI